MKLKSSLIARHFLTAILVAVNLYFLLIIAFDFDFKEKGSAEKPNIGAGKFVDYVTKFHIWKRPKWKRS